MKEQSGTSPSTPPNETDSHWKKLPSIQETSLAWFTSTLIFVLFISWVTSYATLVENFGDNSAYIAVASAIHRWNFQGLFVKHFWGLPYFMVAISGPTGISERTSLLIVSWISSFASVLLAHRLWGGRIAILFCILNFDWLQRSCLGGSEPLFAALLFASFLAIRRNRWPLAALLASLATITRPLGIFLLLGIGLTLLWRREWLRLAIATAIGTVVGLLYMFPLARYLHDPLATVHSYGAGSASTHVSLFGIPFYAIVKGTFLYPAPLTNLLLSYGWIFLVLIGIVAMVTTRDFRDYARNHVPEIIFAAPYLLSLYCYNSPYFARGSFARFAIPVLPFVYLALSRWIPQDRRFLWALTPVTAILAAASALGISNVIHQLLHRT